MRKVSGIFLKRILSWIFFFLYCFGFVFIFSVDVCEKMYNVLFFIFFFWVDDYYIIGVLVKVINVK